MLLALLLTLVPAVPQTDGPDPIAVKLNHEQFSRGDKARVYVQAAQDGYLVVLHADPEGRVRVLFPRDPSDDAFVRGGRRQEIRSRSDRDAFMVEGDDGAGTVLAAVSTGAFSFDGFVLNGHWDYRALGQGTVKDDPLAGLLDIVRRMSGDNRFEYYAATYVVGRDIAAGYGYGHGYGYGYGYGYPRFGFGLGYGYGRPLVFNRPRVVIPSNTPRSRYTPVEARPRSGTVSPPSRSFGGSRSIAPRDRGGRSWSGGGRSSGSRGGGVSRPSSRPSGGRGGFGGGGRRH